MNRQDRIILEAVQNSPRVVAGLKKAAEKLGCSFYSTSYRYHTYLRPANRKTKHLRYHSRYDIEQPYDAERIKYDRWYFADVCKEMADKGICIDNIARQFGLACRTINTWIRLARTFPSEERCTEFAPSFYQRLLKYNDPVKALQICREIHKIDPDIIWWATGNDWSRRLFDQKVPVSKLQNVLNQLEKENSERTEQPADFIDPEWLKEITIRLAELERELQAARRLNQTCLKMLCNPVYKKTN